jgi:transposase
MIFVTIADQQQRQELEWLTRSAVGRVAQRALMVIWSSEKVAVAEIALRLHCKPKCVRKWLRRFDNGGANALMDLPRSGRPSKLSEVARQAVFMQVNQPPSCFGYVFAIWTVATLCQHLASRCGLALSQWAVHKALHLLRYRFRRPKLAPRRVDPDREAVHQEIGRRIAEAPAEAVILVEDETDIRLFPVLRRMWMRISQQVCLTAPRLNERRTIFGAFEIRTGEIFTRIYSRKRTLEMIGFLEDLIAHYCSRPVLLILDHASIHKSRALMGWLADHPQIELIYLPKYAAHRDNPIEKLWWHLKGYAAANRCCRSMSELIAVVERYFSQMTPEKLFQLVG